MIDIRRSTSECIDFLKGVKMRLVDIQFMLDSFLKYCLNIFSLLLSISLCFYSQTVSSAAWLKGKGEGLLITTAQSYASTQYWDQQGHLKSGPRFNQGSLNPYLEYGLSKKITIGLNPFLKQISQAGNTSKFGLNNITPYARFAVMQKDWDTISFQLSFNQPTKAKKFNNSLNVTPASASSVYGIIDRYRYLDLRLLLGIGGKLDKIESKTWYADFEMAYRPNFDGATDEFHVDFMFGLKICDQRIIFEIQELNTLRLKNPANITQPNYNLSTIVPNIQVWFTKAIGLQMGVQQDFYGINVGKGKALFMALWWKFGCYDQKEKGK